MNFYGSEKSFQSDFQQENVCQEDVLLRNASRTIIYCQSIFMMPKKFGLVLSLNEIDICEIIVYSGK